jgi:hypothetical protein
LHITRGTWPNVETVAERAVLFRPSLIASAEVGSGGRQYGLHMYDGTLMTDADVRRATSAPSPRHGTPRWSAGG